MTPAVAFDRIARDYDALWTNSLVGRAQRDQVWRVAGRFFQPDQRILDIGCGTGEDAMHLRERGIRAGAIDASAEMVRIARARGACAVQVAVEEMAPVGGSWDGALSNFGVLNCVRDLRSVAASLGRLIRPRGHALICLLNRTCVWEIAHFCLRGQPQKAVRRMRSSGDWSSLGVLVRYLPWREVRRAFEPAFTLVESRAVGLFVPPSYVSLGARPVRLASAADALLGGLPCLRALGDHRLYVFRRRDSC